jgi:hypothetical protein
LVDFWVNTQNEEYQKIGEEKIISPQEEKITSITHYEIKEPGMHRFYAFVYYGVKIIDNETDKVFITFPYNIHKD